MVEQPDSGPAGDEHRWTGPGDDSGEAWSILEEFASVVSHELRTPLSVVKGAIATILERQNDLSVEQMHDLLEMIARNADLTLLLLDRVGLARDVDSGDVRLVKEPVDLADVVREVVSDLQVPILAQHPTAVSGPDEVIIEADPTAVREIVFNLLSNAAKYSEQGAHIEVVIENDAIRALVIVRNHGSGVAPGDTDRIFEKFQRIGAHPKGTGLGLFISRGLARAHGGDLEIQPATDTGSEFILTLPVAAA